MPGATWHQGIDLVAVERAMSRRGRCPKLTEEEVLYAVAEMTAAEGGAEEIAERLGLSSRTVTRWRKALDGGPPCRGWWWRCST
jgi:hypothetical protein